MTDSSASLAERSATRRAAGACLWIPALACLSLSALGAARLHLWRDEFATTAFSSLSLTDLGRAVRHVDALLAPYYALVHLLHDTGASGAGLRVPSVLAAAAAVLISAALARRWWGDAAAVVCGLTLTINPLFAQLAIDARPYALSTLCAVLSTWLLDSALEGGSVRRWVGYCAVLAAAGLLQPFAVLIAAAHLVLVLGRGRAELRRFAVSVAAALIVLTPSALVARGQTAQVHWIAVPSAFRAVGTLGNVIDYQTSGQVTGTAVLAGAVLVLAIVLVGRDCIADARAASTRWTIACSRTGFALALLVVPWAILLIGSYLAVPVLTTHYLAVSTVGVALLMGGGTAALGARLRTRVPPRASAGIAAAVALVLQAVLVLPTTRAVTLRTTFQDDFAGLATALDHRAEPGDAVAVAQQFSQTGLAMGVAHYTGDRGWTQTVVKRLPTGSQPLVDVRRIRGVHPLRTAPFTANSPTPGRLWLITVAGAIKPAVAAVVTQVGCRPTPLHRSDFGELTLSQVSCGGTG